MNRIPARTTTLTLALLAAAGLTLAGCNKRDDMPPTGAGPGTTTTTPSDTLPGGTSTTPGGGTTMPGDSSASGTMTPTTPMPSASAASQ